MYVQAPDYPHINYLPTNNIVKDTSPSLRIPLHTVNVLTKILSERIKFLHVSIGYPAISNFRKVIQNGNLASFPGNLAKFQIGQNLHFLVPSQLGHMTQEYQGM